MPRDFNPLSTGLCDAIDRYTKEITSKLKVAQPFNDFEADVNQDFLTTVKNRCEAMLELIDCHQRIHYEWIERREDELLTERMGQGLINPAATPDE